MTAGEGEATTTLGLGEATTGDGVTTTGEGVTMMGEATTPGLAAPGLTGASGEPPGEGDAGAISSCFMNMMRN